jgi:putative exporter of polyketide antibiotics
VYAAAVAGIGIAVGGLAGAAAAAPAAWGFVGATLLVDMLAPALGAPDCVHQLALTAHLGRPMVGEWDAAGIAACAVLAAGGVALGSWGMRRRDVGY